MSIEKLTKKRDKLQRQANRLQKAANKLDRKIRKQTEPVNRVHRDGSIESQISKMIRHRMRPLPPLGIGGSLFGGLMPFPFGAPDPLDADVIDGDGDGG